MIRVVENLENKQTEFNVAIASLQRLHELLKECNEYSRFSRVPRPKPELLFLWRDTIRAIYAEISPKLLSKEKKLLFNKFKEYGKLGSLFTVKKTEHGVVRDINIKVFVMKWEALHDIEISLRFLADGKGMLITDKPGVKRAIAQME